MLPYLTLSEPSSLLLLLPQSAKPLGSSYNTSQIFGHLSVFVWVGRSVAAVELPQAVLPAA